MFKKITFLYLFFVSLLFAETCRLYNPDIALKDVFFNMDGYVVDFHKITDLPNSIQKYNEFKEYLGGKMDLTNESINEQYAIYNVYSDGKIKGYALCVNQTYYATEMELVLFYDEKGNEKAMYYQQMADSELTFYYKNSNFYSKFFGLNINTLATTKIKNPFFLEDEIYNKSVRAVKKNFLIMDFFVFRNKK